jgi:hypothetical protein
MVVSRPPCRRIGLRFLYATASMNSNTAQRLKNRTGVKLGELYDFLQSRTVHARPLQQVVVCLDMFATDVNVDMHYEESVRCHVGGGEVQRPATLSSGQLRIKDESDGDDEGSEDLDEDESDCYPPTHDSLDRLVDKLRSISDAVLLAQNRRRRLFYLEHRLKLFSKLMPN